MKTRFVMLHHWISNQGITKELSMVPYILGKYYDYDTAVAAPNISSDAFIIPDFLTGHTVILLDNTIDATVAGNQFLEEEAASIDILGLVGIYPYTIEWASIYKRLNPRGKIYVRLDLNVFWLERIPLNAEVRVFLSHCDLISVENKIVHRLLNDKWSYPIEYVPNGFYRGMFKEDVPYSKKENIILTVGRLGTSQKRTEVLMEAFAGCAEYIPGWRLVLAGSIEESFQSHIDMYFQKYPLLKDRVEFTGLIVEKERIKDLFFRAKIFCLPSQLEAMAHVLFEALASRCFMVLSGIEEAEEITDSQKHGRVFPVDGIEALATILREVCHDEDALQSAFHRTREYAFARYEWVKVGYRIHYLLQNMMKG